MPGHEETNVRLPLCAFEALTSVAVRWGVSRDEAARRLLREHVRRQEALTPSDRLTHISSVLRYPAPPRRNGDPRADRPLRLRLVPGTSEQARAVSLRLPGQSPRAHRDYQARLLTDAVMTSIAVQEPFADDFLNGLLPLLRQGAAIGLWQLAVAAANTDPENAIHDAARAALGAEDSAARRRLLLVAEALDEEVAWHSADRFQVAANIARDLLSGANAKANEQVLYEQRTEWDALRRTLRNNDTARAYFLQGTQSYDWSGRGGSAVWRAQRRVEVQDFEDWLLRGSELSTTERHVRPPGWRVCIPKTWRAYVAPAGPVRMPEPYAGWLADGRLLTLSVGPKLVAWPLVLGPRGRTMAPVLGIEPIIAAAQGLRPEQISGFIEAMLVDWGDEEDDSDPPVRLYLSAHSAYEMGFIDADQRRQAMAEARAATLRAMSEIIDKLPDHELHRRPALEQAMRDGRLYARMTHDLSIKFRVVHATWMWPRRSVVDEITAGTAPGAVRWLATSAHRSCARMLQQSMQQAWRHAFEHRAADFWSSMPM